MMEHWCEKSTADVASFMPDHEVKSILKTEEFKSCPDVTSFMLDHDDGTLV
jgi:hypothetical protein